MNKRSIRGVFVSIALALLCLAGCSAQSKLEGSWASEGATPQARQMICVFGRNNTIAFKHHIVRGSVSADFSTTGTYKIDGNHIDCTITSTTINYTGLKTRFGAGGTMQRSIPRNVNVDLTWNLKDSQTLDLTVTSAQGGQNAFTGEIGKTAEFVKQS